MDEKLLEIREYAGPGYQPLIDFAGWRVAILNYLDGIHPERIDSVERHTATDEVFVLLKGEGVLFVGTGEACLDSLVPEVMAIGKVYNVKRGAWHTIVLSPDASVLLVENCDTGEANSEYSPLQPEHSRLILETARREQAHWHG
jgi:hypothetical protein